MSDLENGPSADDIPDEVRWAHEMSDPREDPDSPYGHPHVILDRLADWVESVDPYVTPWPPSEITNEIRLSVINASRALNAAIIDAVPYPYQVRDTPEFHEAHERWLRAYKIRAHVRDLSAQFLLDDYTDSNTDEPCDVEYNVTGLVAEIVPGYERPDEIQPAYVGPILYPTPEDDEGNVHDLDPHSRKV